MNKTHGGLIIISINSNQGGYSTDYNFNWWMFFSHNTWHHYNYFLQYTVCRTQFAVAAVWTRSKGIANVKFCFSVLNSMQLDHWQQFWFDCNVCVFVNYMPQKCGGSHKKWYVETQLLDFCKHVLIVKRVYTAVLLFPKRRGRMLRLHKNCILNQLSY